MKLSRQAHNLKVASSNLAPATNDFNDLAAVLGHFFWFTSKLRALFVKKLQQGKFPDEILMFTMT
jgi:hypothetical protein